MSERHPGVRPVAVVALLLLTSLLPLMVHVPTVSAQEGPGNLLSTPSFERSYDEPVYGPRPYHWSINPFPPPGGTEVHQDDVRYRSGFHSAMISAPDASAGTEVAWYQRLELEEDTLLGMGGWVVTDLGEGGSVSIRLTFGRMRPDPADTWDLTITSNETAWTELTRAEELAPSTQRVYFQCVLSGPGTVWFDDVWLGEPSDTGNPPFIVSVPPVDAAVGEDYTYMARAVDLEGDDFTFDLYRGPDGMTVSPEGQVNWTPSLVPEEAVKVVLRATDVSGLASYQDYFVRVSQVPVQRPVYAYLYSGHDDHVNDGLSSERYDWLLSLMEHLRRDFPDVDPTVNVLFNGVGQREMGPGLASTLSNMSHAIDDEGWIDLGYTAYHEPTYSTSPLYDPSYPTWDWKERVTAIDGLLARPRDPLTGAVLPTGKGGLVMYMSTLGEPSTVAGVGGDGSQLHALDRFDDRGIVLGIHDVPEDLGAMVGDTEAGTVVAMLSEDPASPYGVYWQGSRLHLAMDEVWSGALVAREGASAGQGPLEDLDRRRVNVVPVLVMDRSTYCNGSTVVSGDQVRSPTEWAYSHPGSPRLPAEATYSPEERQARYDATCATLEWLAGEFLPSAGGTFLSPRDVEAMVDPGTGITVSSAELATAADDLIVRRNALRFPGWVGISWGYCRGDYQYFSLADMYGLLVQALAAYGEDGELPASLEMVDVLGPRAEASPSQPWNRVQLGSVVAEAGRQLEAITDDVWRVDPRAAVPVTSSPGGVEVNAMEFLLLMAGAYLAIYEEGGQENPLLNLLPSTMWPVTRLALAAEGRPIDAGDSWTLKPASANTQVDEEAPQVRYVTPADGAIEVPRSENVTVTFSERMDEAMDLAGTLVLDPPVDADLRWVYHRLVLDPVGNLSDNVTYTATLSRTLRDAAGNNLVTDLTWSFSTTGRPNLPPVLHPLPEGTDQEVEENRTVRFALYLEDDGPFPLSIEWWLDGVRVPDENDDQFIYQPTHTDDGLHTVTVIVSDAASPPGQSTFTWNLTVINVNVPLRVLDVSPGEGEWTTQESEGGTYRFSVSAEDPDEGVLVYAWSVDDALVDNSWLSDGGATMSLPTGYETAGEYQVVCRLEDRAGEGLWLRWTLQVEDTNRPPSVSGVRPSVPPTVESGKAVEVWVNATDPDGDDLRYVWYVDAVRAEVTDTPYWNFSSVRDGSFPITVTVEDGRGGNATASTTVNVLPQVEPSPPSDPTTGVWLLVLAVVAAIGLALLWPRLRERMDGD